MTPVALITGGGSGIGRSIALRAGRTGAKIAVLDIDRTAAERSAAEIGGGAIALAADVADAAAVQAAVARLRAALGPITVLVNVAGIGSFVPLLEMTHAQW